MDLGVANNPDALDIAEAQSRSVNESLVEIFDTVCFDLSLGNMFVDGRLSARSQLCELCTGCNHSDCDRLLYMESVLAFEIY